MGLVNVARGPVSGAQIGLVNVADTCSFCLGLVSVVRRGRLHLDLWGQESGLLMVGIKHGGLALHNIYGVGVQPFGVLVDHDVTDVVAVVTEQPGTDQSGTEQPGTDQSSTDQPGTD